MQATTKKSPAMGTASKKNSETGHFIGDSEPPKSAKILAPPKSKATQANEIKPLLVAGELLACKYLTAAEKVLLARYTADPGAQNRQITIGLGISASGLKSLKHDLIAKKVLVPTDQGFTIRLPNYVLVRDAQGSYFVPESEARRNGYKMAPAPRLTPPNDLMKLWTEGIKDILECLSDCGPAAPVHFTADIIKKVETECQEGPERDRVLAAMKEAENLYFLHNFIYEYCPRKFEAKAHRLIQGMPSAQMAAMREKAAGMMLAGIPEPRLLVMFTRAISQQPGHEGKNARRI
jgi:hypothetical protein